MKDTDLQLACVLLFTQIYDDIRKIVREEVRAALNDLHESEDVNK